jgi:hypothetical protein
VLKFGGEGIGEPADKSSVAHVYASFRVAKLRK